MMAFDEIIAGVIAELKKDVSCDTLIKSLGATLPDYTVKSLSKLINESEWHVSVSAEKYYGHYKVGRQHRFMRAEIDFRRQMGLNLIKR